MIKARQCEDCGAELPLEAPPGLCPACRIKNSDVDAQPTIAVTVRETATPAPRTRDSIPGSLETSRRDEWRAISDPDPLTSDEVPDEETQERYVLDRVHSDGGLGRIWLARDGRLNREVALKELLPHQVRNPEARTRFLKEAQITGQLEHPNIVPIYELGRYAENGRPFYTMRFLRGKTLRATIAEYHGQRREGVPSPREFRRLLNAFVSVCHAVAYAHFRGVVHRDLKPENVVLGDFGQVVLLDWGLAKLVREEETAGGQDDAEVPVRAEETMATMAGAVMGRPRTWRPSRPASRRPDRRAHRCLRPRSDPVRDPYRRGASRRGRHRPADRANHRGRDPPGARRRLVRSEGPRCHLPQGAPEVRVASLRESVGPGGRDRALAGGRAGFGLPRAPGRPCRALGPAPPQLDVRNARRRRGGHRRLDGGLGASTESGGQGA